MPRKKLPPFEMRKTNEVAKKLKRHREIDKPYALGTYMTKKGVKLHRKKIAYE